MSKTKKFMIYDWAGNILFNHMTFDSFEDAWGHIYECVQDEERFDDYYVEEV